MSSAETIKEYLISLGFKVDEQSFKKFDEATGLSTKSAAAMGLAVVGAAAATEAFVAKVAKSLDTLYFASKRTGTSADEVSTFSYAIGQLGGTAEGAQESMKSLAQFMRENYTKGFFTQVLGVSPEHFGNIKLMMDDMARKGKAMQEAGQEKIWWAQMRTLPGFSTELGNALLDPDYIKKEQEHDRMLKEYGINLEESTKAGHEFTQQLNQLEESFSLLADRLAKPLIPLMEQLNRLILGLTGASNGTLLGIASGVGAVSAASAGGIAAKFGMSGAGAAGGILSKLGGVGALASAPWVGSDIGHAIGSWIKGGSTPIPANSNTPTTEASGNIRNNNPGNLEVPGGGAFQKFPDAMSGLEAMGRQLQRYAKRGKDTISDIVSTYAPAADNNNVPAYIADVVQRTGFSASQHLNLQDPETLTKLMNAMVRHEQGRNPFEATLIPNAANNITSGISKSSPTLNQTTNITVSGSDNQRDVVNGITTAQNDTNRQCIRNLAGACQ